MNVSAKNKTLLFIGLIFILFSLIMLWGLNFHQNQTLKEAERNYYTSMQDSYAKVVERQKEFYFNRLRANIDSPGVIEAIEKKDRQKLFALSKGRWKTLQKENPSLIVMHFHLSDGRSLLRMHDPMRYGDTIANEREMVRRIHREQKQLFGYEVGKAGMAYRFFEPIVKNGKYLGALELGLKPDRVLQDMHYYHDLKGALFVRSEGLNDSIVINEYALQSSSIEDRELIAYLQSIDYTFVPMREIEYRGKTYNVYSFALRDFEGNNLAKALFFQDITQIKEKFHSVLVEAALFIGGLVAIIMLFVDFGFRGTISTLDRTNRKMEENQIFLNSILDGSDHAIITTSMNGVITLFNSAAEKMLGYSSMELIGKKTPVLFHDPQEMIDRAQALSKRFGKTVQPGFEVFVEKTIHGVENNDYWTYITKTGEKKTVHLHISALMDLEGNVSGYLGIAEDVTQEIQLQNDLTEYKEELETILNTSKDGIAILDLTSKFLYANPAYVSMSGFTFDELMMKKCIELSIPEDVSRAANAIAEVLKNGFIENFEKTCIVKDGKKVTINMSIALMPDRKRLLISTKNVTEAKEVERSIKEYVNLIDENIITSSTDLGGNITYASEAFCEISGYTKEELLGENHRIVHHPDMSDDVFKEIWESITAGRNWQGEIKNKTKEGGYYWVYSRIYPIYKPSGEKYGYTAIRQDITDKKTIEEIAIRDGMTGIYNRRYFNEQFPKMIQSAKRSGELLAFILLDVDHFKQYNDTYGHQMGDQVLIHISATLSQSLQRSDDMCFRLGGEEFGILFKPTTAQKALEFADELRKNIEKLGIEHVQNSAALVVTVSIGLIVIESSDSTLCESIYKRTDDLLYQAKKSGRNRIAHEPHLHLNTKETVNG